MVGEDDKPGYNKRVSFKKEVKEFIEEFQDEQLFCNIPGRKHGAFPDVRTSAISCINKPKELKERLLNYCKRLDDYREVLGDD